MSLIDLNTYKTLNESKLMTAHNELIDGLNYNFTYTLNQVSNPLPNLNTGKADQVVTVIDSAGAKTLGYRDPSTLVRFDQIFDAYINRSAANQLNVSGSLSYNLVTFGGLLSSFKITASDAGLTSRNSVEFNQLSSDGDMQEVHTVNQFNVAASSANISTTVAGNYVEINRLKVGNYFLPTAAGSVGQFLRLGTFNNLEFSSIPNYVIETSGSYEFAKPYPVAFPAVKHPNVSLMLDSGAGRTGIGYDLGTAGVRKLFVRMLTQDVAYTEQKTSAGSPMFTYMKSGFVLPGPQTYLDPLTLSAETPIGAIWYENDSIVLRAASGLKYIKGEAVAASVNTVEAKDFELQPSATLKVAGGSDLNPALKIGNSGITSSSGDIKLVIGSSPALKVTNTALEAGVFTESSPKLLLDSNVGINNPANPAYSFSGASGLGLYRADTNTIAMAVKGKPVVEFAEAEVNVKGNKLTNLAEPVVASDAATKGYIDAMIPVTAVPGALTVGGEGQGSKLVQSEARYLNGTLEIGGVTRGGAVKMRTPIGGSAAVVAPSTSNNVSFVLPANQLEGGVLQSANGVTRWVSVDTFTGGSLKADGSVPLTGAIRTTQSTSATNPLIGIESTGMYINGTNGYKIGFSAQGSRVLEVDRNAETLKGLSDSYNAPLIRLNNTVTTYSNNTPTGANPTYSFAGDPTSGVTQTKAQAVTIVAGGAPKLTATATEIQTHGVKIRGVGDPEGPTDAATKKYVDSMVSVPHEITFRVTSLPVGWTSASSIILSIYDKALIYQSSSVSLVYESSSAPETIFVPNNFNVNARCQVYVNNSRLMKMESASGIRQVTFLTSRSLLLNYGLTIGDMITIQVPS